MESGGWQGVKKQVKNREAERATERGRARETEKKDQAYLIVDNKGEGNTGTIGPLHFGFVLAVAHEEALRTSVHLDFLEGVRRHGGMMLRKKEYLYQIRENMDL